MVKRIHNFFSLRLKTLTKKKSNFFSQKVKKLNALFILILVSIFLAYPAECVSDDLVSSVAPDISVNPTILDFGTANVGESVDRTLRIDNNGNATLRIFSVTTDDPQFSIVSYTRIDNQPSVIILYGIEPEGKDAVYPVLNPGNKLLIKVRFTPLAVGPKFGRLNIRSNDPDEPIVSVDLQGNVNQTQVPDIRVSPSAMNLGEVVVGQSSSGILHIYNDGSRLLQIHGIISNDPQFTVSNYSNVEPNSEIIVTVQFTPSSQGSKAAILSIVSNDPDEPIVSVSLQGKGISILVPQIRVEPSSINFGEVQVGQTLDKTFRIFNDGNAILQILSITSNSNQFVVSGGIGNIQPGGTSTVLVRFAPSSPGLKAGIITIVSNDQDEPNKAVSVQGNGVNIPAPDIRVIPAELDFGEVYVGSTSDKLFRIYNDGNTALIVSSITSNSNQFIAAGNHSIAPGGKVDITVRFAPSSPGIKIGVISIASNDPDEPTVVVSVQGKGVIAPAPDIRVVPTSLNFGDVYVGLSLEKQFRIYNDGITTLVVSNIISNSNQFIVASSHNIAPGGYVDVSVRFTPTSSGLKIGVITITSNDPDESAATVSVQGKGVISPAPNIRVTPASLDFGDVYLGSSLERQFQIYNDGNAILVVSSITSNSNHFIVLSGNPNVYPGGRVDITVRFTPLSLGLKVGIITITSNDPDEPAKTISIQGRGVVAPAPDIRVVPTYLDFGEVEVGESLSKDFRIYNDGIGLLRILDISSDNNKFIILDEPNIPPGGAVDISVRFAPAYLGMETGTITITSNDPDETTVLVSVRGKGIRATNPDIHVSPLVIDFGKVEYGESLERAFLIYNFGDALLRIFSITSSSNQFEILDDPDVPSGQSAEIHVRFSPATLGEKSATVTIYSNDPDESYVQVRLYGECVYPEIPTAGWQIIRQQNIISDLRDVYFVNGNEGWVVGSSGTVAYSSDGGSIWTPQTRVTSRSLKGVYFTDSSRGWAVGQYGTLLSTTNGGYSWSVQNSGMLYDLNAITFIGSFTGWIAGEAGIILATNNGYTWTRQSSGTQYDLNDVYFISSYRGWAVGNYGTIMRTNDGGQTWTSLNSGTSAILNGVDFINDYEGWAVGSSGIVLHTQNGGQTWSQQSTGVPYYITLMDVDFIDSSKGWAVGQNGTILHTENGGLTWAAMESNVNETLMAVQFRDDDKGWAVGTYSTILKYYTMPTSRPFISSVTVYGSPARTGDVIRVTATGQVRNHAKFSISGVVENVVMAESVPGTYTGTYTVPQGVNAPNAIVTVSLTNDYGDTAVDRSKSVKIDSIAVINSASVSPRSVKSGDVITITMNGEVSSTGRFAIETIIAEGIMSEVPGTPGNYVGSYTVPQGANAKDVKVTVRLIDGLGNTGTKEAGQVTIDTVAEITSASVTGSPAKFGDSIIVVMIGEAGGIAKFLISDVVSDVAMSENQPGVYTGSYTAPKGIQAKDKTVTVQLRDSLGNIGTHYAGRVTIDTESRIDSVSVSGSPVKAGGTLTVTMMGEANGTARFGIAGVIDNVSMTQIPGQPGTYMGSYTAVSGVNVINAVVTVTLTDAVGNVGTNTSQKVTIDSIAPVISTVIVSGSPAKAGGALTVTMVGEANGIAYFGIAGVTDNVPMTQTPGQPGNYAGSYTAVSSVNVANAVVTVILTDAAGNVSTNTSQRVTIDNIAPVISNVTVTGSPVKAGGALTITMVGEANGTAYFGIAGVIDNVSMSQTPGQPGTYVGSYIAVSSVNVTNAVVTVTLADAVGNVNINASQRVTIDNTAPIIATLTVTGSPAKAGGTLTVTMMGEVNGTAYFGIAGVIGNVPMMQASGQPGIYAGSYTAVSGVNVTNAVVTVTLADAVGNVSTNTSQSVTIDTTAPVISTVIVTGSPAKAGGTLTVTMMGEANGAARFGIAGVIDNVPMTQTPGQPGIYAGTYIAVSGVNVTNAVLTTTLTDAVGNVSVDASQRVTIDTTVPEISSVIISGIVIKAGETISITLIGQSGGSAWFSIADVVDKVSMLEAPNQPGKYTGAYAVPNNINVTNAVLTIAMSDAAGNVAMNTSNRVTIDTVIPEITSVNVTGSPAKIGESIGITVVGETKGKAQFSIAGLVDKADMTEAPEKPGTYKGTYTVANDTRISDAILTVTLKDTAGNVRTDSSKKVNVVLSWDVNRDGVINVADLVLVAVYFGTAASGNEADVNKDGRVDIQDLIIVCKNFSQPPFPASPGKPVELWESSIKFEQGQLAALEKLYESIQSAGNGDADLEFARKLLEQLLGLDARITRSKLMQNYPNPFNPETWIPYELAKPGDVTVSIYSSSGQLIRTLDLGYKRSGSYSSKGKAAYWDGTNESGEKVASGIYFYAIKSGEFNAVRKMLVIN